MRVIKRALCWSGLSGLALLFISLPVIAANILTVKVSVYIAPDCVINGNSPIEVNFGDAIMTTRVGSQATSSYGVQPINFSLVCTTFASNNMKITITGIDAGLGNGTLKTTNNNLGIALLNNNTQFPINGSVNFTYPTLPTLKAVLVKRTGATLTAGPFSSSATMKIEYQ